MGWISVQGYEPKHLSYSTVSGYRMCGKKMFLEKIAKVEQRPGLAALGGNAVHTASEVVDHFILKHGFDALDAEVVEETPEAEPSPALDIGNGYIEPNF